jgi:predicted ATP-grasp superfamily ATP-dependent carboligase
MKGNVFKPFSIFYESNCNSNILLTNCGFSPDFFNKLDQNIFLLLEKNNIKKIKSENDIISLRINEEKVPLKKAYEAEDKETYKKSWI